MKKRIGFIILTAFSVAMVFSSLGVAVNPAAAAEPLKIGAPIPLTGPYAADGVHFKMGLEMAVDEINDAGGLLGRPLKIIYFDLEDLMAEKVNAAAKYLLKKHKVDVVFETYADWGSDFLLFGKNSKVPFFHGCGSYKANEMTAAEPDKFWNMFQYWPIEADYALRAYQGLTWFGDQYNLPNKKIALVHGDIEWDLLYTQTVAENCEKDGWEVVINETAPYGTTDWGPILTKIRKEKPALICLSILDPSNTASFILQFMENPTPSLIDLSYMVVFKEVHDAVGDKMNGMMGYVTSFVPPTTQANRDWVARFKKKYGMDYPKTTPPAGYSAVMTWADAVKTVGKPRDFKAICKHIRETPYQSLVGLYDFNNPWQGVRFGENFPIPYAQYQGDGRLAFFGTDDFMFPPYIQPAWTKK